MSSSSSSSSSRPSTTYVAPLIPYGSAQFAMENLSEQYEAQCQQDVAKISKDKMLSFPPKLALNSTISLPIAEMYLGRARKVSRAFHVQVSEQLKTHAKFKMVEEKAIESQRAGSVATTTTATVPVIPSAANAAPSSRRRVRRRRITNNKNTDILV